MSRQKTDTKLGADPRSEYVQPDQEEVRSSTPGTGTVSGVSLSCQSMTINEAVD